MSLNQIILRLARNPDTPDGDERIGYVLIAPLDAEGRIDLEAWRSLRSDCIVRRFHPDPAEAADGWLTHNGSVWRFHYDEAHEGPDEKGHRLGDHIFRPGEYVSISHHGGETLVYQVRQVLPLNQQDAL